MAADHPSTPVSGEVTPDLCAIGTYLGRCTLPAGHDGRHSPFAVPLSPADPTREEAHKHLFDLPLGGGVLGCSEDGCDAMHPSASPGEAGEDEDRARWAWGPNEPLTSNSTDAELIGVLRELGGSPSFRRVYTVMCDVVLDAAARLSSQSEEIARLRRRVEIMDRALTRYTPCADHRDKLVAGECQVCRRERAESQLARLREAVETLGGLVDDLSDDDECQYDHHGYCCQTHCWMATEPECPHARAKAYREEAYRTASPSPGDPT